MFDELSTGGVKSEFIYKETRQVVGLLPFVANYCHQLVGNFLPTRALTLTGLSNCTVSLASRVEGDALSGTRGLEVGGVNSRFSFCSDTDKLLPDRVLRRGTVKHNSRSWSDAGTGTLVARDNTRTYLG